ncbi:hypothetical protein [Echinimonas agarilytica]|uniref:Uncharacterized protein n=1 Tax=Echinimonas agarilytica TaxID=1215918 RepID=A0AA42B7L1_9GAMM|nr:hypothetical protein [Echinimonas agarilytica]MCM2680275.1 hypothetical protein [Echinimonas agarilytica]
MTTQNVRLLAGPKAYSHIIRNGLQPNDISTLLGASGGPKWFILSHLDQYLSGEFFANRNTPLNLLGTSAGGWRFACYCQKEPVAATQRFIEHYASTVYSSHAKAPEITEKAFAMVDDLLGLSGIEEILQHPTFRLHVVVARAKHFAAMQSNTAQWVGLAIGAAANTISRKLLPSTFERILFHNASDSSPFLRLNDYPTRNYKLTEHNLRQVLLATGAIPMVIDPQRDISGPGKGCYSDGGIVDYHFDIPNQSTGIVLYPHFYKDITPGWFDKGLWWRKAKPEHYNNVVIAAPSPQLVNTLPYGKISDRNDFKRLSVKQRLDYWKVVISEGERMAEFFAERHHRQDWPEFVELMPAPTRA